MPLLSFPIALGISLLWYIPCIKAQGNNRTLNKKDYIKTAFKYGFLYCCLLIIVTEVIWDGVFGKASEGGLGKAILADFFRAALLEEFFKLTGFLLAKKKPGIRRKTDYIMTAGLMGLVYGVVEKAVLGNITAAIVGSIFPMHILWQFGQGGHYYEYEKAKAQENKTLARREWMLAVCVPFLFHGLWDSALSVIDYSMKPDSSTVINVLSIVLMLVIPVVGIVYTVKTLKKVKRIAREEADITEVLTARGSSRGKLF